jgi:hypothetical protein
MGMKRRWLPFTVVVAVVMVAGAIAAVVVAGRASPWWSTPSPSAEGALAEYRIDGGPLRLLGSAAGIFPIPSASERVRIGQEIDVHSNDVHSNPVPTSTNSRVLVQSGITDGGATASFQARSPGAALLETTGFCAEVSPPAASEFTTCSILAVTVVP